MKRFATVLLILLVSSFAGADERRETGIYAGAGLSRGTAKIIQPGVDASLLGWGNNFETGFDMAFSNSFGFTVGAEISDFDFKNSYKADDYLDQTLIKPKGLRAGFFYKNVTLGGGYRMLTVDLKSVSSTDGASAAHLEGNGNFAFLAFSIDYKKLLRGSFEAQANSFKMDRFEYTDYQVGLKAFILLNGLLD